MSQAFVPSEEEGLRALREHVVAKAQEARAKHGVPSGVQGVEALLADPSVVRYPTRLVFDAEPLLPGEFAWARPVGRLPEDGFELLVHPHFAEDATALPLLVAYHLVSINYFEVATHVEAELYGAALLGLEVDEYYRRICELADSMPASPPRGCGGGSCGCRGGEA